MHYANGEKKVKSSPARVQMTLCGLHVKGTEVVVLLLDGDSSVMRENNFCVKIECIRDKGLPNFSSNTI